MEYSTYWSILDTPSKSIQSNSICLFIAIGAGLLWFLIKLFKKENGDGEKKMILWATGLFAVLGIAGYVSLTFFNLDNSNEQAIEMLNSNKTPRVAIPINDFEEIFNQCIPPIWNYGKNDQYIQSEMQIVIDQLRTVDHQHRQNELFDRFESKINQDMAHS